MTYSNATIFIIDDDQAVRHALSLLIKSVGLTFSAFASAQEFLQHYTPELSGCLVLDIRMPGMSGLDLQQQLNKMGSTLPIIFITGHGDVPMAVEAIRHGALDFLQKPFRDQDLLDRINDALEQDAGNRQHMVEQQSILSRIASLTPREREVMDMVVNGSANKVIAIDLNLSQRTVEIHRARVMEKMQARSLAQLVKLVMRATDDQ